MYRLIVFFFYFSISFLVNAQVTFVLNQVPNYTPIGDTLFVAGTFNNWNPYDINHHAIRQPNGTYVFQLPAGSGTILYKFTRGGWARVEGNQQGLPIGNRSFTFGNGQTVNVTIQSWEDLHGGGGGGGTRTPNVSIISNSFQIPQLNRTRRIWLYLPNDYQTSTRAYPVLYMQDGQNLFDASTSFSGEWQVDETLRSLQNQGDSGVIVVGIDNGGGNRLREYSPWLNTQYISVAEGDDYVDFLVNTLKPYIDLNYRTKVDRGNTGIAGSSMGALISLYAAQREPNVFSKVGVFSPAFWFGGNNAFNYASNRGYFSDMKIYLICGGQEGQAMVPDMARMRDTLISAGYGPNELRYTVRQDGQHSEWFWRREFGAVYQWLFTPSLATNSLDLDIDLHVYPNPSSQKVSLYSTEPIYFVEMCSLQGKFVMRFKPEGLTSERLDIDVANLSNGMYILHCYTKKGNIKKKLLINH